MIGESMGRRFAASAAMAVALALSACTAQKSAEAPPMSEPVATAPGASLPGQASEPPAPPQASDQIETAPPVGEETGGAKAFGDPRLGETMPQEREELALAEPPEAVGAEPPQSAPPAPPPPPPMVSSPPPTSAPPGITRDEASAGAGPDDVATAPALPRLGSPPRPAPVRSSAPPPPAPAAQDPDRIQKVTVFFGTDRALETVRGARVFGRSEATGLYYGTVDVTIPPGHQEGQLESPQWWKFEFTADPEKHVTYQGYSLLTRDAFYQRVRSVVGASKEKQAFVFVHGFNTSFENAARRTAQLYKDLRFDGAPIFYSWPSQAELSLFGYNRDVTLSARTEPRLEAFLKEVATRTGARRIHLIAHSMGNKALVNALARIAANRGPQMAPMFNQIILTAPDIDREVFLDLARRMRGAGQQVTLYASANDKALQASKSYNGFPRAGDAGASIVVAPGITTVDASNVTTAVFDLEHSYFASEKDVLTDLRTLIATGRPAPQRGLKPVALTTGGSYYVID